MTPEAWRALPQAERDAAYNNTAAVPDSGAVLAALAAASERLRMERPEGLDIPYGPGGRQRWDLFAGKDRAAPWLVFVHGGYWQRNSRDMFAAVTSAVLAQGWSAALPGYTLAPDASLCAIQGEIGRALDWLAIYRTEQGCVGPLVLSGWSAGAQLAAMHLDHPAVDEGLLISGIFDLAPLRDTYLNAALRLTDADIAACSPMNAPLSTKPVVLAWGGRELAALERQSRLYAERRQAGGLPTTCLTIAGADHFSILGELQRGDGQLAAILQRPGAHLDTL